VPCLTQDPDRLYELVPVIYRLRDADQGYPLKAFLRVIAEQVNLVEQDIAALYDNWFIETCADWVVPYIGSLINYQAVHDAGEPTAGGPAGDARCGASSSTAATADRNRILFPRREVANTVRARQRKGTLAALQDVATATSGWPTRVVEISRQLGITQNVSYLYPARGRTIDLREGIVLDALDTAFNTAAHTVDIRRGGWTAADVRAYVWRLRSYSITRTPAYCYEEASPNSFLFNPLGIDTALFTRPQPAAAGARPEALNLPAPITRRNLEQQLTAYYGEGKSFQIWQGPGQEQGRSKRGKGRERGRAQEQGNALQPVPVEQIVAADLTDWTYRPLPGYVAVDPELGRIAFPPTVSRKQGVWVSYHYGFSADMGSGEYARALPEPAGTVVYRVGESEGGGGAFTRITDALTQWQTDKPPAAAIELTDSTVYVEPIRISLAADQQLILRARSGARPVIRMLDWQNALPDSLSIYGEAGSWFTLDGVVVIGRGLQLDGDMAGAVVRHATLVPGWSMDCDCEPKRPTEPSVEVNGNVGCLTIDHSISGAIEVNRDQARTDPVTIRVRDSIVDATSVERTAIVGPGSLCAHAILTVARSSIFGSIEVRAIELAENSILLGSIRVCRRQQGCIRFCYVTPGSRTPRRYECQPDLVEAVVVESFKRGEITADERDVLLERERVRVEPEFNSTRYGDPTYGQLTDSCAPEITRGAEDQSEMGAFHDLYQPQRAANLRARLAEYAPAGIDAVVEYAT
jgi:hypothetical protein